MGCYKKCFHFLLLIMLELHPKTKPFFYLHFLVGGPDCHLDVPSRKYLTDVQHAPLLEDPVKGAGSINLSYHRSDISNFLSLSRLLFPSYDTCGGCITHSQKDTGAAGSVPVSSVRCDKVKTKHLINFGWNTQTSPRKINPKVNLLGHHHHQLYIQHV